MIEDRSIWSSWVCEIDFEYGIGGEVEGCQGGVECEPLGKSLQLILADREYVGDWLELPISIGSDLRCI